MTVFNEKPAERDGSTGLKNEEIESTSTTPKYSSSGLRSSAPARSQSPAKPSATRIAKVWRFLVWPTKIGAEFPIPAAAVETVEAVRAAADYCVVQIDGQTATVICRPDFFEALRRAAFGHAPLLTLPTRSRS